MTLIRATDVAFIETPSGNAGAGLATTSRGARETSLIRQRQQPGGYNPPHYHDREEVMLLLAGRVSVSAAGEAYTLAPGDTLIIPARTPHQIENDGDDAAEWLLLSPAGLRYFHANGDEANPPWAR